MTAELVSDLNDSLTELQLCAQPSYSYEYVGPSVVKPEPTNTHGDGLDNSSSTIATTECSESSWMGDSFHGASNNSPSSLKAALAKKPTMKILLETPNLDLEDSETTSRSFNDDDAEADAHAEDDQDEDDDSSMTEILQGYLAQKAVANSSVVDQERLDAVSVPARRPKLYRTPTPDPDGLYMAIRNAPRRARKKRTNVVQQAEENEGPKPEQEADKTLSHNDDNDLPVPLCRNKSFEGIMGEYVRNAVPKRAPPPRQNEKVMVQRPAGASLGASRSFDEQDFLQALGADTERRGGRRPGR